MIEAHAHLSYNKVFPEYFLDDIIDDVVCQSEVQDCRARRIAKSMLNSTLEDKDGKQLIEIMDNCGIHKSVLLAVDLFYCVNNNEDLSELEEVHKLYYDAYLLHPNRFVLFAGIDPNRGEKGLKFFDDCVLKYNFKGLKLYPPTGFEINDDIVYPYYERCQRYKLPVYYHVGPSAKSMKNTSNYPNSVFDVANKYPGVIFILGHAGILHIDDSLEISKKHPNVYLEISGFQKEIEDYEYIRAKFRRLFDLVPNQILFGTDWPLFSRKYTTERCISYIRDICDESNYDSNLIFYSNAVKAFGL